MTKLRKLGRIAHRAVLLYLAVFTVPAALSFAVIDAFPEFGRALLSAVPSWPKLTAVWLAAVLYFCACLALSPRFRERFLPGLAGFRERDEREEFVTAKAARGVFLATLACLLGVGVLGLVQPSVYEYERFEGPVPASRRLGQWWVRDKKPVERVSGMWIGLGSPVASGLPRSTSRIEGSELYFVDGGPIAPEYSRFMFALAALQVLLFHLFARRVRG